MRSMLPVIACVVLVLTTPLTALSGQGPKPFGLAVFGGYETYAMSDVKEAIDTPSTFFPGATTNADMIDGGACFGAGFRWWPSERVAVAFDVSRLLAKTTGTGVFMGAAYEGELTVPATSLTFTYIYFLRPSGLARMGLGAGVGYYLCTGKASATAPGGTLSTNLDGSGFGVHAEGVSDIALTAPLHAEVAAGYRYAKTTDVETEGFALRNADGSKSQVDWSGVMARVGLTVYLGRTTNAKTE